MLRLGLNFLSASGFSAVDRVGLVQAAVTPQHAGRTLAESVEALNLNYKEFVGPSYDD